VAGSDVEEAQFVRTREIVGAGLFDRIARILEVDEVDALDHAAIGDIETGDDADADGHRPIPALPTRLPQPGRAARHRARGR
jgi:hypothetical protein